jgi:hypothetical protein
LIVIVSYRATVALLNWKLLGIRSKCPPIFSTNSTIYWMLYASWITTKIFLYSICFLYFGENDNMISDLWSSKNWISQPVGNNPLNVIWSISISIKDL